MEICIIRRHSFRMQSAIAVGTPDGHILGCLNNSMVLATDSGDRFHNDKFDKYLHCSAMLDYSPNQIFKKWNKMQRQRHYLKDLECEELYQYMENNSFLEIEKKKCPLYCPHFQSCARLG